MERTNLNYKYLVMWLLCLCSVMSRAQQPIPRATLTGQITNAADGQPLPFASVYLNGTTRGTTTDEKGLFTLTDVPFGSIELVVSYTGFSAIRQAMRITETRPRPVVIALSPLANQLADVVVKAGKDKTWLKQLKQFEYDLFGTSSFAGSCVLMNPEVLSFTAAGRVLMAEANAPLVIMNEALGYRLRYTLLGFRSQPERVVFGGTTLFEVLTPASPKQAKQWQRNRQTAYQGSLRHLLVSLAAGTYEQEGFLVYQADPSRPLPNNPPPLLESEIGRHLKLFDPKTMLIAGTLPHERWLRSLTPFEVFYTRIQMRNSPYRDAPYAFSQLILPKQLLGFTVTGDITAPLNFDAAGYLSDDRLATALPDGWQQETGPTTIRRDSLSASGTQLRTGPDATLDTLVHRWQRQPHTAPPAIFLQIDKPLYLTGDRLWLSAYLLDARRQQLDTALVGTALNVELWSANQALVQHQWLPVTDGRAVGSFRLSDTLSTGTYWLRAYTEADRQRTHPAFERPLWIVNSRSPKMTPPTDNQITKSGKEPIRTANADAPDAPFRASVVADSAQVTLSLDTPKSTRIPAVFVLIDNRGKLLQSGRIPIQGAVTTLRLSTLTWPSGQARLSLIDSTGRVWATRSVQVPQRALPLTLTATMSGPEAGTALPRSVSISLRDAANRPVQAYVSLAITNADKVPSDSLVADFPTYLRTFSNQWATDLSPSTTPNITLHGRVVTTEKLPANVVLMLNDGQQVMMRATTTDLAGRFQIDQLNLPDTTRALVRVTNSQGKAMDGRVQFGQPATPFGSLPRWAGADQLLTRWQSLIEAAIQRQEAEPTLYRQNGGQQLREVVVRATKPIDQRPEDIQRRSLHNQVDQTILLRDDASSFDNLYSLIRAKVPQTVVQQVLDNGQLKYSVKLNGSTATLMNVAVGAVVARGSTPPPPIPTAAGSMQNPLFLMDGFPINDTDGMQLLAFSPSNIERVEVLKTGAISAMYGVQASRGVIAFYTKMPREGATVKGVSRQILLGYPAPAAFSTNRQSVDNQIDVLAWQPLATTDQQGQIKLPVVIPKSVRAVRLSFQGITDTGQPISVVQTIMVKQ